ELAAFCVAVLFFTKAVCVPGSIVGLGVSVSVAVKVGVGVSVGAIVEVGPVVEVSPVVNVIITALLEILEVAVGCSFAFLLNSKLTEKIQTKKKQRPTTAK